MFCKMVWKFCEIWKILWEFASRWAKFCEILSHSVACMKEIFFKLATNGQRDKEFLLTSKICPQEVVCPWPGAIYMYKII